MRLDLTNLVILATFVAAPGAAISPAIAQMQVPAQVRPQSQAAQPQAQYQGTYERLHKQCSKQLRAAGQKTSGNYGMQMVSQCVLNNGRI
jgi:hypothetical protein